MAKFYSLALPVYRPGDDLHYRIEKAPSLKDAFKDQAEMYEEAAQLCRRMASVAAETSVQVTADHYTIFVESDDTLRLEALLADGVLDSWEDEGEVEDFEDGPETERNPAK